MVQSQSINDVMSLLDQKLTSLSKNHNRTLIHAEGNLCFWVHNGPVLKNLVELKNAMETLTDEQFGYHVNKEKNDFASWVASVLQEPILANKLNNYRTRKTMHKTIGVYLRKYYGIK